MKKKLIEITPAKYRCEFEGSCPALFTDDDSYIIIGKVISVNDYPILEGRIGVDEIAIKVPSDLIRVIDNK